MNRDRYWHVARTDGAPARDVASPFFGEGTLFRLPFAQDDVGSIGRFVVSPELVAEAVWGCRDFLSLSGRILALRIFAARWGVAP